jgi:glycosyltransferase involved in cell wall biosynthesis
LVAIARLDARVVVQRGAGAITGLVALVTRCTGRRFVYSSANVIDFDYYALERVPFALQLFGLGRRLASSIVVQSDEQAKLCATRWGRPSTVIRSLVEPAPRRTGSPSTFLWIGRLVPYKHPEVVVELARRLPEVQFSMVASPSPKHPELTQQLDEAAESLTNLTLFAPMPRHELGPLYESAVAALNTSSYEGVSNVLLEAWSRGVPALVYRHDPDQLVERYELGWAAKGSLDLLVELAARAWRDRHDLSETSERCRSYVVAEHAPARAAARWESALKLGTALR